MIITYGIECSYPVRIAMVHIANKRLKINLNTIRWDQSRWWIPLKYGKKHVKPKSYNLLIYSILI